MKFHLTGIEQEILEYLWNTNTWTSGADFWKLLNRAGRECKRQTVNTYLTRLVDKGLLLRRERTYMFAYSREEFERARAAEVLDEVYQGTFKDFFIALTGGNRINKEEADELRKYLEQLE